MTTPLDTGETQAARHVADEVKADQSKEVGLSLAYEYLTMGQDSAKFAQFLNQVKADNAQDQKSDKNLPGIDFGPDFHGNLRVNLTTPGLIWGNHWRDKEEVFADIKTQSAWYGSAGGGDASGNETVIADTNSDLEAWGNVNVIALDGSVVTDYDNATVTAGRGSTVYLNGQATAEAGSSVIAMQGAQVTALAGSFVRAQDDSQVTAKAGAFVNAWNKSHVKAEEGSQVQAHDQAQVNAAAGSEVINFGDDQVIGQPGAKILTPDQAKPFPGQYFR